MTFKCMINRSEANKKWKDEGGNVQISDLGPGCAQFGNRVTDETIIREFLRSYGLNAEDDGTFSESWLEFAIVRRPGAEGYRKTFYVSPSRDGKWATVTGNTPYGQRRNDGYMY